MFTPSTNRPKYNNKCLICQALFKFIDFAPAMRHFLNYEKL